MKASDRRLAVIGCSLALGTLVPVALYQSGLVDHLPDPPGDWFDSDAITSSKAAHPFGIPDSFPGLVSYGTTLGLLLASRQSKVAERLLGVKLAGDAAFAGFNVVRQVVSFRKLCSWCTGTALATALVVYGGRNAISGVVRAGEDAR